MIIMDFLVCQLFVYFSQKATQRLLTLKLLKAKMLIIKIQTFRLGQLFFQLFVYFSKKKVTYRFLTLKLEFMRWSSVCLLFSNAPLRHFQSLNSQNFTLSPVLLSVAGHRENFSSCFIHVPSPHRISSSKATLRRIVFIGH